MISIIIPVHNEENILKAQVGKLISNLGKYIDTWELILVENGSKDNTKQIIKQINNQHKQVKGISCLKADYGYALRQGMLAAKGKWIFNFDIDYWDVDFIRQVLALEPFGYDFVVASKNSRLSQDNRSKFRKLISSLFKYALYYGFGLDVSDTHGIKAWRNDKQLRKLITETISNAEIFDTELAIRSFKNGRKHLELPTHITEMRKSVSHILPRAWRGFLQVSKLWWDLR